jgi:hypothetical protein
MNRRVGGIRVTLEDLLAGDLDLISLAYDEICTDFSQDEQKFLEALGSEELNKYFRLDDVWIEDTINERELDLGIDLEINKEEIKTMSAIYNEQYNEQMEFEK